MRDRQVRDTQTGMTTDGCCGGFQNSLYQGHSRRALIGRCRSRGRCEWRMSREDDLRRCPVSAADTGSTCGRGLGQTVPGSDVRAGECQRGWWGVGLPCDVLGQLGGVRRVELDVKGEVPGDAWQTERREHFISALDS